MDSTRIGSTWRADAPAKLNLFLEVLGKRDDGYHEIETLMVAASVYDTLYFTANQEGTITFSCDWAIGKRAAGVPSSVSLLGEPRLEESFMEEQSSRRRLPRQTCLEIVPSGSQNTVWRALDLFRQRAGVAAGATIRLVKRIPSGAGLGGASSDAAAALMAANQAWRVGWSRGQLAEVGALIGSDVPFFLGESGTAAICRGRGEQVSGAFCGIPFHFVLVHPPVPLSTAKVYAHCRPSRQPLSSEGLATALASGNLAAVGRRLFNRLEIAAAELSPWIKELRARFQDLDVLGFRMSGSGSSFFGICRHRRHARRLANLLQLFGVGHVFAASSVSPRCRLAAVSI